VIFISPRLSVATKLVAQHEIRSAGGHEKRKEERRQHARKGESRLPNLPNCKILQGAGKKIGP